MAWDYRLDPPDEDDLLPEREPDPEDEPEDDEAMWELRTKILEEGR